MSATGSMTRWPVDRRQLWWLGPMAVAAAYAVLSLIATYPAITCWNECMIGGSWDSGQNIWNFWWLDRAVREGRLPAVPHGHALLPSGRQPGLPHPEPFGRLRLSAAADVTGMSLACLLQHYRSLGVGHGAFSAYLLGKHITRNTGASFVAGIIFAYSPFALSRMHFGHFDVFSSMQLIPLVVLVHPVGRPKAKRRYTAAAAFVAACIGWQSLSCCGGDGSGRLRPHRLFGLRSLKKASSSDNWRFSVLVTGILMLPVILPAVRDYADFADQMDVGQRRHHEQPRLDQLRSCPIVDKCPLARSTWQDHRPAIDRLFPESGDRGPRSWA